MLALTRTGEERELHVNLLRHGSAAPATPALPACANAALAPCAPEPGPVVIRPSGAQAKAITRSGAPPTRPARARLDDLVVAETLGCGSGTFASQ